MIVEINSTQNPRVKRLSTLLQKSRNRKKEGLFLLEGIREVERALLCGYNVTELYFSDDWSQDEMLAFGKENSQKVQLTKQVFGKVAYRESVKNVVAVAEMKSTHLDELSLKENPLIIVLETVEKPGNLGAILRSADAAGVDAVMLCDQQMDIYNPNVIRNSLGGFFNIPIVQCSSKEAIDYLKFNAIQILATYLEASIPYYKIDMKKGTALVMGSEAFGITKTWVNSSDQNIIIPMTGVIDSLNVSNAASIVMFEARRQRSV